MTFITIVLVLSFLLCMNTVRNYFVLNRRIPTHQNYPTIALLIPARNEAENISNLIESLKIQDYPHFEVFVLDDESTDSTFEEARNAIATDERFNLLKSTASAPTGWLGKSWACHQLSQVTDVEYFCFLDADVTLKASALRRAMDMREELDVDVLCPYPKQITTSLLARIVQPLLQWSWMSTLPLDFALKSSRRSLTAANGQFLLISKNMYEKIGGHHSVKNEILEDIAIVRQVKSHGGTGGVWDGSAIANCLMYRTSAELIAGYSKSLWNAFGSPLSGFIVALSFAMIFLSPFVFLFVENLTTRVLAFGAIALSFLSRFLVHNKFEYALRDVVFYPVSFIAFFALMLRSIILRKRRKLHWKDRNLYA
jgi:glycosyltransferase involved in cell wall biosynthesis